MVYAELIELIQKKDVSARQKWFESFYEKLAPVAQRYAKSAGQAEQMLPQALHNCYEKMRDLRKDCTEQEVTRLFISECVSFVRSIKNEYFVATTVHATSQKSQVAFNLFENGDKPDVNNASPEVMVEAIQQLVPAQRLIFNLHVVDGYSLQEAADLLESSEATVKSNLEKARFSLQKNIENSLKPENS